MKNSFLTLLAFCLLLTTVSGQNAGKNYEFRDGQWYNGDGFVKATWYTTNGVLSKKAPSRIDSVIDLSERYVIPPFGDAYCSSISDNSNAANVMNLYMNEGVFYLQVFGNTREGRMGIEPKLNKPSAPDAIFANGGLTCTLGYPFVKFEGPAAGIRNPNQWGARYAEIKASQKMLGDGYWFIDNKTALDANWEKIKAQNPGVLDIFLLDVQNGGGKEGKGLTEETAKLILKKAHKAGMRVYAHIETTEDLRLGLKLGVDGFANLPGSNADASSDASKYALSDDDLKKLAKKKTPVVTHFFKSENPSPAPGVNDANIALLNRLLANDVNVVIGSDDAQRTIRAELNYWYAQKAFDNAKVFKVLCENTPKAIFPKRKIAKFEDGYEANFLVLKDDPLVNLLKARVALFRVKQGVMMK